MELTELLHKDPATNVIDHMITYAVIDSSISIVIPLPT